MRYFIALDFEKPDRDKFHAIAKKLKTYANKARIVESDHVHLTLAFLGEIDKTSKEKAEAIVKGVRMEPFTLEFDTVSYFEPKKGGRIFWIGPDAHPSLEKLHHTVFEALKDEGFSLDERPFTPHVTLARGVRISKEDAGAFRETFKAFKVPVRSVSLMVSSFKEGKLIYRTLSTKELLA